MKKYKHIFLWMILASFVSFLSVYHYMSVLTEDSNPQEKTVIVPPVQQRIEANTKVYLRERYELCRQFKLDCGNESLLKGTARADLNNLTKKELDNKYPPEAGWQVIWQGHKVVFEKTEEGLCPEHKNRWHLALDETGEWIAIYYGPSEIGIAGGLIKRTEIRAEDLPGEIQDRIINGNMEFLNWEDLIATLDSLEEYYHE